MTARQKLAALDGRAVRRRRFRVATVIARTRAGARAALNGGTVTARCSTHGRGNGGCGAEWRPKRASGLDLPRCSEEMLPRRLDDGRPSLL